jgi:hypothetical protein
MDRRYHPNTLLIFFECLMSGTDLALLKDPSVHVLLKNEKSDFVI